MLRFMCMYFSHLQGYLVTTDSKSSTVLWHRDSNSWALILVFSWEEGEKGDLGFLKPYVSTNSSPQRLSVENPSRWVYQEMAVLVFRQSSIVFTSSHCYSFQEGMLIEWHVHGLHLSLTFHNCKWRLGTSESLAALTLFAIWHRHGKCPVEAHACRVDPA